MHYVDGFELMRERRNGLFAEAETRRLARTVRTSRQRSFRRSFLMTTIASAVRAMGARDRVA